MIWVFVFGGIALAGLLMLVAYAIWLAHKASDVFGELKVLGKRGEQLLEIASQIEIPESPASVSGPPARRVRLDDNETAQNATATSLGASADDVG
ncbi:MAG TPA: hypothetical protein VIP98_07670 [Microlunatus sp.]